MSFIRSVFVSWIVVVAVACGGERHANVAEPALVTLPEAGASAQPSASAPAASTSASAALAEPPPRSNRGSGPDGCFTREELAKREAEVKADREATYLEALRRLGLAPEKLAGHVLVHSGQELSGPPVAAHVEERDVAGKRLRVVVMPPTGGCGDLLGAFEFARSGNRVFAVARRVKTRKIDVTACGCPTCKCEAPSYARGCGGMRMVADTILGYELPTGTDFGGEREVWYVEDWVSVSRALPPQPVCVAPPPPP